jgi:phosphoglycerol transferase MdoB-like AlkP superfamily enzyme
MGTEELKIDWEVGHRNHSYWGPHDDVSFELLGRILKKRKKAQEEAGKDKRKPWFFNHFTITSHVPFWERPDWYKDYKEIPDFSVLYENRSYSDDIKRYLELRYFQDMELGKFMDQMEEAGVLNDTIVFIVGDHGQAPEYGVDAAANRKVSAQRVAGALIAQGRLGDAAGTIFDDVASHMDVLNTMADIVGLPPGGFIQSGVGRSLKRKLPFGQHVVWSNSPETKLSAIQGHTRIEYDREFNKMNIYDVDLDHEQSKDLYPEQIKNQTRKEEITRIFQAGRYISKYFTDRYKKKCILKTSC